MDVLRLTSGCGWWKKPATIMPGSVTTRDSAWDTDCSLWPHRKGAAGEGCQGLSIDTAGEGCQGIPMGLRTFLFKDFSRQMLEHLDAAMIWRKLMIYCFRNSNCQAGSLEFMPHRDPERESMCLSIWKTHFLCELMSQRNRSSSKLCRQHFMKPTVSRQERQISREAALKKLCLAQASTLV